VSSGFTKKRRMSKKRVKRYKARLVVKDYSRKYDIDHDKVFAPVARLETIRLIIVTAA
jgi:hypothetical protein